jgi:hypothetical protein
MIIASQRLGKHVPEVTLSTIEGRPKAGIVKSEWTSVAVKRLANTRFAKQRCACYGINTRLHNNG